MEKNSLFNLINKYIETVDSYVWGYFLMFLLVGTGIYLCFRMRFVQIRFFKHAWSLITGKWDDPEDAGEVTHFQALSTALAATIGTALINQFLIERIGQF